jgi:anti-anti-sigma factor
MSDFRVTTALDADRTVVALSGECDLRVRDQLSATLLAAVESSALVVVDLAAVRFLDSSGLYALVTAHQAALERAGRLCVVNAVGTVASVLEITGVVDLLRPPPDVDLPAATR